jgi:Protein of unknown function (DUF2937)
MMRKLIALIGGVGLGLAVSQFPEFAQQYAQRLGGAVDELSVITARFDQAAAEAGLTRPEAFVRYEQAGDDFITGQGEDMEATFVRYDRLTDQLASIQDASATERLVNFGAYFDTEIAARAFDAYKPAVPVTVEGIFYAAGGAIAGYGLVALIMAGIVRLFRRRRVRAAGG